MNRVAGVLTGAEARASRPRESGQVLALFALAIFALLGAIGLGVDGSRALEERRNAQAVVDHAALAAASASCGGAVEADSIAAGYASATSNAYAASASIVVQITKMPDTDPTTPDDDHVFRAYIRSTIQNTFARVLGVNTFDIGVEATAGGLGCGSTGGSGSPSYAMFAGGDTCGDPGGTRNIKISGNDHIINGRTHTNGGVDQGGDRTAMNAMPNALTYVWPDGGGSGQSKFSGSGNTYNGPKLYPAPTEPWPTGYGPAAMQGTARDALFDAYKAVMVNGTNLTQSTFNNVTTDGVWYTETTSTLDVKDITHGWRGVIVSKNSPIVLSVDLRGGSFHAPTTPPPGTPANVVVVSGYGHATQPCDQFSISRPGNTGTWEGIWWAPLGQVRIAGERTTINKGIIAHGIQMEGNWHVINGGSGGSPGTPASRIVVMQ